MDNDEVLPMFDYPGLAEVGNRRNFLLPGDLVELRYFSYPIIVLVFRIQCLAN